MLSFDAAMTESAEILPRISAPALIVSETLTFQIIDLQKVGRGHRVQCSHRPDSTADVRVYKWYF